MLTRPLFLPQTNVVSAVSAVPATTTPQYTYFQPPPFIQTYYQYPNINGDKTLQEKVTNTFLDKTIKWLENDKSFSKSKKYLSKMKSEDGYDIMHKILRLFVKNGNTNWYDLSDQSAVVKSFIKYKMERS